MLAPFAPLLARGPVGAFACYELAMAEGVLRAAGRGRVVVLVAGTALRAPGAERLVCALRGAAEASRAQVSLQADHVHDLETVELALELGVQAVMADFSPLPFEANVAFTREAVALAREFGAAVEGELGRLAGGVDADAPQAAEVLTDPAQAAAFVAATGVDCLAVAVGNVHGALLPAPRALDWARLAEIRARGRRAAGAARRHRARRRGHAPVAARGHHQGQRQHGAAERVSGGHRGRASGAGTGRGPGRAARAPGGCGRGRGALDP